MFEDDPQESYLDLLVEAYERHEENFNALEDNRFGEIYLFDKSKEN